KCTPGAPACQPGLLIGTRLQGLNYTRGAVCFSGAYAGLEIRTYTRTVCALHTHTHTHTHTHSSPSSVAQMKLSLVVSGLLTKRCSPPDSTAPPRASFLPGKLPSAQR